VKNGTVLIFALTWGSLSYLFTHDRKSLDNVQGIVHTVLGEEHKPDHYDRIFARFYSRIRRILMTALPGECCCVALLLGVL